MIINQIAAGGGGSVVYMAGSTTPTATTKTFSVTGLDFAPTGFVLLATTSGTAPETTSSIKSILIDTIAGKTEIFATKYTSSTSNTLTYQSGERTGLVCQVTEDGFSFSNTVSSGTWTPSVYMQFYKGVTYFWYAWRE